MSSEMKMGIFNHSCKSFFLFLSFFNGSVIAWELSNKANPPLFGPAETVCHHHLQQAHSGADGVASRVSGALLPFV